MLFLAFMIRISRKEELGFLTTHSSLRPRTRGSMRLCVRCYDINYWEDWYADLTGPASRQQVEKIL